MDKSVKSLKSGFVIKLSCETVQKLSEEDQKAKVKDNTDNSHTSKKNEQLESETSKNESSEVTVKQSSPVKDLKSLKETSESIKKLESEASASIDTSWGEYAPYVTYEGDLAIYTDPTTQHKYTWDKDDNCWKPMSPSEVQGREYSYENDTHIYTEADGSKFFWDAEKKAWIPKVDDDFLAYYQMSYGFIDNTSKDTKDTKDTKDIKDIKEKKEVTIKSETGLKRKSEPQWFEQSGEKSTKVYVSNLPLDLTEEEFVEFMQKCGLVERDPVSQKMKVKLYKDKEQDCFKGDALCTYIKIESVDLALNLLDGSDYKGNKIKVEKAHFQLKGEYNPALKPKKKKKKELEKLKKMQQKLFDWRPEKFIGERSKHERIVIVKNLFHPTDFDKDVQLILDYQQDLREECGKCGEVRKVVLYDGHPEGVAQITMKEAEQADAVIELINGRWFGKRQITAETWDGRTKYRIAETDADINKRIDKWGKFLEGEETEEAKLAKETKNKNKAADESTSNKANVVNENPDDVSKEANQGSTELKTNAKSDDTIEGNIQSAEMKSED